MTTELTMLLWSIILTFILIMIPAYEAVRRNGAALQSGPRDNMPTPSNFNKRASRLSQNMQENMLMFTALVLVAHTAGVSDEKTVLGAQIFFYARVAHALVYLMGMGKIRPVFWAISVVGMGMIAVALF